jgi:hypothetical protein
MVNSKQKGAQFERDVCVALSKWVSRGKKEDVFWRSAMSGGRATVAQKRGKRLSSQVGDISCINPMGANFINAFAVECKFYAKLDFEGLLTGKGKLLEFWKTIKNQSEFHGKFAFLVAKQNRTPAMVCLRHGGLMELSLKESQTLLISRPYDLYILELSSFVRDCVPLPS